TVHGFAAARIDADELIDKCRIPGKRISEKILADSQSHTDDLSGVRKERSRLDPHVVSRERRCGKTESEEKADESHKRCSFWGNSRDAPRILNYKNSGCVPGIPHVSYGVYGRAGSRTVGRLFPP